MIAEDIGDGKSVADVCSYIEMLEQHSSSERQPNGDGRKCQARVTFLRHGWKQKKLWRKDCEKQIGRIYPGSESEKWS